MCKHCKHALHPHVEAESAPSGQAKSPADTKKQLGVIIEDREQQLKQVLA